MPERSSSAASCGFPRKPWAIHGCDGRIRRRSASTRGHALTTCSSSGLPQASDISACRRRSMVCRGIDPPRRLSIPVSPIMTMRRSDDVRDTSSRSCSQSASVTVVSHGCMPMEYTRPSSAMSRPGVSCITASWRSGSWVCISDGSWIMAQDHSRCLPTDDSAEVAAMRAVCRARHRVSAGPLWRTGCM